MALPRLARPCVVLTILLLTVSACAPALPEPSGDDARPLTAALVYANRAQELGAQASGTLAEECMKAAGFDYRTPPHQSNPEPVVAIPFAGIVTLEENSEPGAPPAGPTMSSAELEALLGGNELQEVIIDGVSTGSYPTDGCLAHAAITLAGSLDAYKAERVLVRRLYLGLNEASRAASQAPAVVTATGAWSQCMTGKGFSYGGPQDVADARPDGVSLRSWPDAVADAECKDSTGFLATAEAAMGAAERAYAAEHPGLVTEWRALMDTRYERVRAVLDGSLR